MPHGHWPKGKRRHHVPGWRRLREKTKSVTSFGSHKGSISNRALARQIGVDEKTIRRWKKNVDIPRPDRAKLLGVTVRRLGRYESSRSRAFGPSPD